MLNNLFRALAMVQASASEESDAKDPTASRSLVPKDPKMACKVLIDVLAQQPALSRLTVECQIGKTMVLWRTDVNKAITLGTDRKERIESCASYRIP